MKKIILALVALSVAAPAMSQVHVKGYTRKDGTYVAPHYRSSPDSSVFNNYSTQGNVNPYTGKTGTVNPYSTPTYTAPYSAPSYTPPSPYTYKPPCYYNCPK